MGKSELTDTKFRELLANNDPVTVEFFTTLVTAKITRDATGDVITGDIIKRRLIGADDEDAKALVHYLGDKAARFFLVYNAVCADKAAGDQSHNEEHYESRARRAFKTRDYSKSLHHEKLYWETYKKTYVKAATEQYNNVAARD